MAYFDYILNNTFENIQQTALSKVANNIDKRQGSIIYDAIAPASMALANAYVDLYLYYKNTNILTAMGEPLTLVCANFGIIRYPATYAVKKIILTTHDKKPFDVPTGTRFSTIDEKEPIIYVITERVKSGEYLAKCETIGAIGNVYSGDLLPVIVINGLGNAYMTDTEIPARNEEDDEDLRDRAIEWLRRKPFGGNVQHYIMWTKSLDGVGAVQVYPTWAGGGTVKLSILDGSFNPCKQEFLDSIKEYFMPEPYTQKGYGIAPIGSDVTVSTPVESTVDIRLELIMEQGYSVEQVKKDAEEAIKDYLFNIKKDWDKANVTNQYTVAVYRSKIISAVLEIPQILSITSTKINNADADLKLIQTGQLQEVPKLGTVTLVEI